MRRRYRRLPPQRKDTVAAFMVSGVFAAGVGAVTFYLARLFLAREPMDGGADLQRPALPAGEDGPSGRGA